MKYESRFPKGLAIFASGSPGYTQVLIKCKTSVGDTDYLSTWEETKEVEVTFP